MLFAVFNNKFSGLSFRMETSFDPNRTLPVSVVSGGSTNATLNGNIITETFSSQYTGLLSNSVLLELGTIYYNSNNKSNTTINATNKVIILLCRFMVQNTITSLEEICSSDLLMFIEFIKRETTESNQWSSLFSYLRSNAHNTSLGNLIWPKCLLGGRDDDTTQGHSVFAFNQMGIALCKEIDRIRIKNGRLTEAMKAGRVITPAELASTFENTNKKSLDPASLELSITKADFICTIIHYLPGWPVLNRGNVAVNKWGVYQEPCGIRLNTFVTSFHPET